MKTTNFSVIFCISTLFVTGIFLTSCREPDIPTAVLTVLNENNEPVEGAEVTLLAKEGNTVYFSGGEANKNVQFTNAYGQVSYKFQYEAIYHASVKTFKQNFVDKQGTGVIILKKGKKESEIIRVR